MVRDATGAVLPGASVQLVLSDRGVARSRTAGATGRFGFAGLPPGRYAISATHPGFQEARARDIVVEAGSVTEVGLTLAVAGITESVSAAAPAPLDIRVSGLRETVDRGLLDELPNGRDVWTVLEQTPGILMNKVNVGGHESGQQSLFSAAGTAWTQNQYYLNGVNATDPSASGASITYFSYDSFEEIEVSTSGHRAEIQTPGVFLNIVPKKGTNRFAGSGSFFYEHERFQAENLSDGLRARGVGQANRLKQLYDWSADLGGPIARDRAWFYVNAARQRIEPYLPGFFFENGEPGVDLNDLQNVIARASAEVRPGHELGLFFFRNDKFRPYRGAGLFRPLPETTFYQDSVTQMLQASWSGVFDDALLVEARVSGLALEFPYGQAPDAAPEPTRWELNTGIWRGGSGRNALFERARYQAGAAATLFLDGPVGAAHEFKAGFEATYNPATTTEDLFGAAVLIYDRTRPIEVRIFNDPVRVENHTRNLGFYLQDSLVRGRLALEVGARADVWRAGFPDQRNGPGTWDAVFASLGAPRETAGRPAIVQWFSVAPRLGVTWRLTDDGRTLLRASAGRYYHQPGTSLAGYANANARAWALFRFDDRDFDGLLDDGEVNFDEPLQVSLPERNEIAPDLKQPRTDELTVGLQREFPWGVTAGITGILRRESELYEDRDVGIPVGAWRPVPHLDPGRDFVRGTADDVPVTLYLQDPATLGQNRLLLENPGIEARYRGAVLEARRRFAGTWQLIGSVTWSRSEGWLPGPGQQESEGSGFTGPLLDNPNHGALHEGRTFWDRPFIARISGSRRLPWGFSAAASYRHHSGLPNYRSVIFTETLEGEPLPQGSTEVIVEPAGADRSPAIPLVDFRIENRLDLGRFGDVSLQLDVFNVFNLNNVVGHGSRDDSFGAVVGILPPRVARLGVRYRF